MSSLVAEKNGPKQAKAVQKNSQPKTPKPARRPRRNNYPDILFESPLLARVNTGETSLWSEVVPTHQESILKKTRLPITHRLSESRAADYIVSESRDPSAAFPAFSGVKEEASKDSLPPDAITFPMFRSDNPLTASKPKPESTPKPKPTSAPVTKPASSPKSKPPSTSEPKPVRTAARRPNLSKMLGSIRVLRISPVTTDVVPKQEEGDSILLPALNRNISDASKDGVTSSLICSLYFDKDSASLICDDGVNIMIDNGGDIHQGAAGGVCMDEAIEMQESDVIRERTRGKEIAVVETTASSQGSVDEDEREKADTSDDSQPRTESTDENPTNSLMVTPDCIVASREVLDNTLEMIPSPQAVTQVAAKGIYDSISTFPSPLAINDRACSSLKRKSGMLVADRYKQVLASSAHATDKMCGDEETEVCLHTKRKSFRKMLPSPRSIAKQIWGDKGEEDADTNYSHVEICGQQPKVLVEPYCVADSLVSGMTGHQSNRMNLETMFDVFDQESLLSTCSDTDSISDISLFYEFEDLDMLHSNLSACQECRLWSDDISNSLWRLFRRSTPLARKALCFTTDKVSNGLQRSRIVIKDIAKATSDEVPRAITQAKALARMTSDTMSQGLEHGREQAETIAHVVSSIISVPSLSLPRPDSPIEMAEYEVQLHTSQAPTARSESKVKSVSHRGLTRSSRSLVSI